MKQNLSHLKVFTFGVLFILIKSEILLGFDFCKADLSKAYPIIKKRTLSGVPFELMSVIAKGPDILEKLITHISYDLWDEVVTLKRDNHILNKGPVTDLEKKLCLTLNLKDLNPNSKDASLMVQILLNPMWGGRLAQVQNLSQNSTNSFWHVGVDWSQIKGLLPSEEILWQKEIEAP